MPRPKNRDAVLKVIHASWQLFKERGYSGTSYSDIAEKSCVSRPTVQRYFPKKELLLSENLKRLRQRAESIAVREFPDVINPLGKLYLLGQIYLAALLCCPESRRFFCDVLNDRELTDKTITADMFWSAQFVTPALTNETIDEDARDGVIVSMGGLYELMFHCIRHNREFDPFRQMMPVAIASAPLFGMEAEACRKLMYACEIPRDALRLYAQEAYDSIGVETISKK